LEKVQQRLCAGCKEQLILLKAENRCLKCFAEGQNTICLPCRKISHGHRQVAACFERVGPAVSLFREFGEHRRLFLEKDLAAFMVLQLQQMGWPMPTCVGFVPLPFERRFVRGFDPNRRLAHVLGKWLSLPVKESVADEVVLLIEGQIFDLLRYSKTLREQGPTAIYGLAFLESITSESAAGHRA
jgi:predicted amidophosphoribosyltransferase